MRIGVLAAAVLTLSAVPRAAQSPELALGLVRPDGILTPFAVFDGKTWTAAWPEPQDKMVLDGMIERVASYWRAHQLKVPLSWHVVRAGQPALQVHVLEHVVFGEQCEQQVGLLTDMHPRREVDSMPHARMLVTDRRIAIEPPGPPIDARRGASPEGRLTLRPLGTLKAGGATFRIVLVIGYEGEGMSIIEIRSDGEREVLRVRIGGC